MKIIDIIKKIFKWKEQKELDAIVEMAIKELKSGRAVSVSISKEVGKRTRIEIEMVSFLEERVK